MPETVIRETDFKLPIRTEEHLREFILRAFGVRIPDVQACAHHSTPWRAFCDAYFARSPVIVWKASRGFGGKSHLLALLGTVEAITLQSDVNILAGSGQQSIRVHEAMGRFWNHSSAPRYLLASDPLVRETRLKNGAVVQALLASQASVRGPHPQRLRLDEVDEMDLGIMDAALGQPMSRGMARAQTVMSSTHQYQGGTMSEVLVRAKAKGWPVHEWCYRETLQPHGWLPQTEVDWKRDQIPSSMWATEYDLQEPAAETLAISPAAVERMFCKDLGVYAGTPGQYIEIEPPQSGARYGHGADWARKVDWTSVPTLREDVMPVRLVAYEMNGRKEWPEMVAILDERMQRYGGHARHDGTGLGDVVDGFLLHHAEAVILAGRSRHDLFSNYIAAVESNKIVAPYIESMRNEHATATVDSLYGSGHPGDSIVGMALAWSLVQDALCPITKSSMVFPVYEHEAAPWD